ncbi:hypothetical protein CVS40_11176 [Lucilia cuprina]|nr:hypothetical protein CVS40_11176 [Lucilia cuprina]
MIDTLELTLRSEQTGIRANRIIIRTVCRMEFNAPSCVHDLCLTSHTISGIQSKFSKLEGNALADVDEFCYLGSIISKDEGANADVMMLNPYGCETWKVSSSITGKLQVRNGDILANTYSSQLTLKSEEENGAGLAISSEEKTQILLKGACNGTRKGSTLDAMRKLMCDDSFRPTVSPQWAGYQLIFGSTVHSGFLDPQTPQRATWWSATTSHVLPASADLGKPGSSRQKRSKPTHGEAAENQFTRAVIEGGDIDGTISPSRWDICKDGGWFHIKVKLFLLQRALSFAPEAGCVADKGSGLPRRPRSTAIIPAEPHKKTVILEQSTNPDIPTQDWKVIRVSQHVGSSRRIVVILILLRMEVGREEHGLVQEPWIHQERQMGADANAHHTVWSSSDVNARENAVETINQAFKHATSQSCKQNMHKGRCRPPWWSANIAKSRKENRKLDFLQDKRRVGSWTTSSQETLETVNLRQTGSTGPGGVIPADVQHNAVYLMPWLTRIYDACLKWSYRYIRTLDQIKTNHLTASQHAYMKGKSAETALHSLVCHIEKTITQGEYTLVAFLDIEGAFNNVHPESITTALTGIHQFKLSDSAKCLGIILDSYTRNSKWLIDMVINPILLYGGKNSSYISSPPQSPFLSRWLPIDLMAQETLYNFGTWHMIQSGHSPILNCLGEIPDNIDYCIAKPEYKVFTDGSKSNHSVGGGFYIVHSGSLFPWIPGHQQISGNTIADSLATLGSSLAREHTDTFVFNLQTLDTWTNEPTGRQPTILKPTVIPSPRRREYNSLPLSFYFLHNLSDLSEVSQRDQILDPSVSPVMRGHTATLLINVNRSRRQKLSDANFEMLVLRKANSGN